MTLIAIVIIYDRFIYVGTSTCRRWICPLLLLKGSRALKRASTPTIRSTEEGQERNPFLLLTFSDMKKNKIEGTYCVPHDNVDIGAEGVVNMLCNIEIHKITEMVIHIYTCK